MPIAIRGDAEIIRYRARSMAQASLATRADLQVQTSSIQALDFVVNVAQRRGPFLPGHQAGVQVAGFVSCAPVRREGKRGILVNRDLVPAMSGSVMPIFMIVY